MNNEGKWKKGGCRKKKVGKKEEKIRGKGAVGRIGR